MTREQQAKIHEFAGTWKAGNTCDPVDVEAPPGTLRYQCKCGYMSGIGDEDMRLPQGHPIPMPPLEGDYADVVAMKCLVKLAELGYCFSYTPEDGETEIYQLEGESKVIMVWEKNLRDAIFAVVLAYLEQKGK